MSIKKKKREKKGKRTTKEEKGKSLRWQDFFYRQLEQRLEKPRRKRSFFSENKMTINDKTNFQPSVALQKNNNLTKLRPQNRFEMCMHLMTLQVLNRRSILSQKLLI